MAPLSTNACWIADLTRQYWSSGSSCAFGLMANYLYEDDQIAERAEAYVARGHVATSSAVRDLIAG